VPRFHRGRRRDQFRRGANRNTAERSAAIGIAANDHRVVPRRTAGHLHSFTTSLLIGPELPQGVSERSRAGCRPRQIAAATVLACSSALCTDLEPAAGRLVEQRVRTGWRNRRWAWIAGSLRATLGASTINAVCRTARPAPSRRQLRLGWRDRADAEPTTRSARKPAGRPPDHLLAAGRSVAPPTVPRTAVAGSRSSRPFLAVGGARRKEPKTIGADAAGP